MGWLLKLSCPSETDFCVRIYDYEELSGEQKLTVYQYDNGSTVVLPNVSINLLVAKNHIRFLLPSKETFPGSWKKWAEYVSEVRMLDWMSWQEALENDTSVTTEFQKIACATCGGK